MTSRVECERRDGEIAMSTRRAVGEVGSKKAGARAIPALAVLAALSACGQGGAPAVPADPSRPLTAHRAAVISGADCPGTDVHQKHLNAFACSTCHPTGATFGFDVPYTFVGGTTTAGGSITPRTATTPTTCTVACHFPKGALAKSVAWNTPGPLECTECHAAPALPPTHPAVSANATRADCQTCHVLGNHMDGAVALVGHEPAWKDPANPRFHASSANAGIDSCRSCHGADLSGGAASSACATCHDVGLPAGVASWKVNCVMCHGGTELANGAPPEPTWGNAADAVRTGAHTAHLTATDRAPAAPCAACHTVPTDVFTPGHLDGGTAEVVFARSIPGAPAPAWDRTTASCANTYCHAGAAGGSRPAPVWTNVGQGEAACGSCHAVPPAAPHPTVAAGLTGCTECHPESMDAAGVLIPPSQGGMHLDGSLQASGHPDAFKDPASPEFHAFEANRGLSPCQGCHGPALDGVGGSTRVSCASCHGTDWTTRCTMCHGGVANATGAPPDATWGNAGDPLRAGAHEKHVMGGALSRPMACESCHTVPVDAFAPEHLDGGFAEVRFGGVAAAGGATPGWSRADGTCSSVYCHGATTATGTNKTPSWTGGPSQAACGTCHFNSAVTATGFHYTHRRVACGGGNGQCHPGYTGASVVLETHVDGVLQASAVCEACHYYE